MIAYRFISLILASLCATTWAESVDFTGWEAIRVIEQDGRPGVVRAADINGDGNQELLVVNGRYSRLDIYSFRADDAQAIAKSESKNPNLLPLARNVKRSELQLEQLPLDALHVPALSEQQRDESQQTDANVSEGFSLAVLVASPNRVLFYQRDASNSWQVQRRVDLLDGELASGNGAMLLSNGDTPALLIPFDEGIQCLPLGEDGKPHWITPREKRDFADWWLADLDGDGEADLVEQRRDGEQALCWMPGSGGEFGPARVLYDRAVRDARVLSGFARAPVTVLDAAAQGMIRRFEYSMGDSQPMGKLRPLPRGGGRNSAWCGMQIDNTSVLVEADPERPRLVTYRLTNDGWESGQSYPSVGDVSAMASPVASPGTLLLWVKDSGALYRSSWDGVRLGYPQVWDIHADSSDEDSGAEGKVVALATVGNVTWWATHSGKDIQLYRWSADEKQPQVTLFSSVGSSVEQVLWVGGDRLLVRDRRARGLRLATVKDDKTILSEPSSLQRASIEEFRLKMVGGTPRLTRFVNGVAQWLNDELQPIDQVMLTDGRELEDFVPESLTSGWVLEKGAPYLHRIEPDSSGVAQPIRRVKVTEGTQLVQDMVLGTVLVGRDRITQLSEGRPDELKQLEALDERSARDAGSRKSLCHRLLVADVNLDGRDDLLLCDDRQHRLNAMSLNVAPDGQNSFQSLAAWPIFEDRTYPYDDLGEDLIREPRAVCALEFDGDRFPDLAFLCHDRLLIYLGREPK